MAWPVPSNPSQKVLFTEPAENFSKIAGASIKGLYLRAGIVFLADFFGWTNLEAIGNFQFRIDINFVLNADTDCQGDSGLNDCRMGIDFARTICYKKSSSYVH